MPLARALTRSITRAIVRGLFGRDDGLRFLGSLGVQLWTKDEAITPFDLPPLSQSADQVPAVPGTPASWVDITTLQYGDPRDRVVSYGTYGGVDQTFTGYSLQDGFAPSAAGRIVIDDAGSAQGILVYNSDYDTIGMAAAVEGAPDGSDVTIRVEKDASNYATLTSSNISRTYGGLDVLIIRGTPTVVGALEAGDDVSVRVTVASEIYTATIADSHFTPPAFADFELRYHSTLTSPNAGQVWLNTDGSAIRIADVDSNGDNVSATVNAWPPGKVIRLEVDGVNYADVTLGTYTRIQDQAHARFTVTNVAITGSLADNDSIGLIDLIENPDYNANAPTLPDVVINPNNDRFNVDLSYDDTLSLDEATALAGAIGFTDTYGDNPNTHFGAIDTYLVPPGSRIRVYKDASNYWVSTVDSDGYNGISLKRENSFGWSITSDAGTTTGSFEDGDTVTIQYEAAATPGIAAYYPVAFTASNLPTGLTINANTGQITGTPTAKEAGITTVTATHTDGDVATLTLGYLVQECTTSADTETAYTALGTGWVWEADIDNNTITDPGALRWRPHGGSLLVSTVEPADTGKEPTATILFGLADQILRVKKDDDNYYDFEVTPPLQWSIGANVIQIYGNGSQGGSISRSTTGTIGDLDPIDLYTVVYGATTCSIPIGRWASSLTVWGIYLDPLNPVNLAEQFFGGTGDLTFTSGSLPSGLSLSSAGVLSGTPTAGSSATVTVTASDTASNTNTISVAFDIPVPLLVTASFSGGTEAMAAPVVAVDLSDLNVEASFGGGTETMAASVSVTSTLIKLPTPHTSSVGQSVPYTNAINLGPPLSPPTGAAAVEFELQKSDGTDSQTHTINTPYGVTNFSFTGLDWDTQYRFRLRWIGKPGYETSNWSSWWSGLGLLTPEAPDEADPVQLSAPSGLSTTEAYDSITPSWSDVTNESSYTIEYRLVPLEVPENPSTTSTSANSITVTWDEVDDADSYTLEYQETP